MERKNRFEKGLKDYNLTPKEFKNNYEPAGYINYEVCDGIICEKQNEKKLIYPDEEYPLHKNKCVCFVPILNNHFVINRNEEDLNKRIIIVGSCCIRSFLKNGLSKLCAVCKKPHRNTKDNLCKTCRGHYCQRCFNNIDFHGFCGNIECLSKLFNFNLNLKKISVFIDENNKRHVECDNKQIILDIKKCLIHRGTPNNINFTTTRELNYFIGLIEDNLYGKYKSKNIIFERMNSYPHISCKYFQKDLSIFNIHLTDLKLKLDYIHEKLNKTLIIIPEIINVKSSI